MKKIISILVLLIFTSGIVQGVRPHNKAYRVLHNQTSFLSAPSISDGGKEIMTLHRGDTLHATEELALFMEEKEGKAFSTIPLERNGQKGYVYYNAIEPIKANPEDTIFSLRSSSISSETELQRSLYPLEDWALNNTPIEPYSLIWVIVICLIGAVAFSIVPHIANMGRKYEEIGRIIAAIFFIAAAWAEIMHMLTLTDITWFFSPKIVGWGKAILNFILFGIVCGIQCFFFFAICNQLIEDDNLINQNIALEDNDIILEGVVDESDSGRDWSMYLTLAPFVLLVAIFIMFIIDAFSGGEWGFKVYAYVGAILIIPMAALELRIIKNKNYLEALVFPFFYLIGGASIILVGSVLGFWIILIAVLIIALVIALAAVGGAIGAFINGGEITGRLPDGTEVKGYKGWDGKFHANNGNTYKID